MKQSPSSQIFYNKSNVNVNFINLDFIPEFLDPFLQNWFTVLQLVRIINPSIGRVLV